VRIIWWLLKINPSDYYVTLKPIIITSIKLEQYWGKMNKKKADRHRVHTKRVYSLHSSYCPCLVILHFSISMNQGLSTGIEIMLFCWKMLWWCSWCNCSDKGFQHGGRVVYITEAIPPYFGIYSKPGSIK
jgi:hypothetical protein